MYIDSQQSQFMEYPCIKGIEIKSILKGSV